MISLGKGRWNLFNLRNIIFFIIVIIVICSIGVSGYLYVRLDQVKSEKSLLNTEIENISKQFATSKDGYSNLSNRLDAITDVYSFVFDMQDIEEERDNLYYALDRSQDFTDTVYDTDRREQLVVKLVKLQEKYTSDVLKDYYKALHIDEKYISQNRSQVEELINIATRLRDRRNVEEINKYRNENQFSVSLLGWLKVVNNKESFKEYLNSIVIE